MPKNDRQVIFVLTMLLVAPEFRAELKEAVYLATRPDPEAFARSLKVFADARAALHSRLHQHGIPH